MERAALAATLAFLLVLLSGRTVIAQLAAWNIRQAIREEAPERHRGKAGTPTVGGLLLLVAAIVGTVVAARPSLQVALVLLMMAGFGAIGLVDDLLKVRRGRNLGLRARERLAAQTLLAAVIVLYVTSAVPQGSTLALPWLGRVNLRRAYVPCGVAGPGPARGGPGRRVHRVPLVQCPPGRSLHGRHGEQCTGRGAGGTGPPDEDGTYPGRGRCGVRRGSGLGPGTGGLLQGDRRPADLPDEPVAPSLRTRRVDGDADGHTLLAARRPCRPDWFADRVLMQDVFEFLSIVR